MAPVLVGTVPFGFVAGVAAVGAGMTPLQGIALSFSAFSGIAQLVVAQLVAAQSPVVVTLSAALVVSLRFLMYSAALSPHLAHLPARWRVPLAYLMTDQGFAMGVHIYSQPGDRRHRHWQVLGAGVTLFVVWQASVIAGAVAGAQVPAEWSLDFVVTLTFLVLLVPALRTRADLAAAAVASAVVLVAAGLPYKLSLVVASVAGIGAGVAVEWMHKR
jgi:predicted branched-subunit amino acid permease